MGVNRGIGKKIVRQQITDAVTGEITYGKERTVDARYSDEAGFLYKHTENYIKKFNDSALPEGLSWADQGKLSRLQTYIVGDSQLLGYRKFGRLEPITVENMQEIFGCGRRRVYDTLSEAKKYHILKEVIIDGVSWYAYNPIYGLKDKRISISTYIIFQNELSDVLPDWVIHNFMVQAMQIADKPIVR